MQKSLSIFIWFALTIASALSGLVMSSLLLVDYVRKTPVFCEESGCDAVKHTVFAHVLGIPLPAFGMTAFLFVGAMALVSGKHARQLALGAAVPMGLFAALLLVVQKLIGSFCPFCVVTDISSIVLFVATAVRYSKNIEPPAAVRARVALAGSFALAVALPVGIGFSRVPKPPPVLPVPDVIAEEVKKTPPNQVSVIDFVDFECPFCRATNTAMTPVIAFHQDQLRIVRKQVPLRIHPHARDAAKAACCGEELGHGDEFAQALFSAPVEKLTPDECENIAANMGISREKFKECMQSARTEDHIKTDTDMFKAARGHGLPTIWIGTEELKGEQSTQDIEDAVARALANAGHT